MTSAIVATSKKLLLPIWQDLRRSMHEVQRPVSFLDALDWK